MYYSKVEIKSSIMLWYHIYIAAIALMLTATSAFVFVGSVRWQRLGTVTYSRFNRNIGQSGYRYSLESFLAGADGETSRDFILAYDMGKNTRTAVDNRDYLPYVVLKAGSKEEEIGTYLLDPSTGCGDILELGDKGVYQVKNVKFLYKFNGKDFIVVKKKATAKHLKNPWKVSSVINEDADDLPDDRILQ